MDQLQIFHNRSEIPPLINQQIVDIMIHSQLKGFYEKAGFESMPHIVTLVGDPNNPANSDEKVFMLCVSEKGKNGKASFESTPFYFGEDMWCIFWATK